MSEPIYTAEHGFVGYSPGPSASEAARAMKAMESGDVGLCIMCGAMTSRPKDLAGNRYCPLHTANGTSAMGFVRVYTNGEAVRLFQRDKLIGASVDYIVEVSADYAHGSLVPVRCLTRGKVGNMSAGSTLSWATPRPGVASLAVVEFPGLAGGSDPQGAERRWSITLGPRQSKCELEWCDRKVSDEVPGFCSQLCADMAVKRAANFKRLRDFCARVRAPGEQAWAADQFNEENARLSNEWAALRHEPLRGDPKYMLRGCEDDE